MQMNKLRSASLCAAFAFAAILATACAGQKDPALAALEKATSSVNAALSPDADKYASGEVTALRSKLTSLKSTYDAKDYPAVIVAAPEVIASAAELTQSVAAKMAAESKALAAEWTDASGSLPKILASVHSHIDDLGKAKHSPKHVDLATARSKLADAEGLWTSAQSSFSAGKTAEAVAAARDAKAKAEAAAAAINLQLTEVARK
jgi:hypothetical protein